MAVLLHSFYVIFSKSLQDRDYAPYFMKEKTKAWKGAIVSIILRLELKIHIPWHTYPIKSPPFIQGKYP